MLVVLVIILAYTLIPITTNDIKANNVPSFMNTTYAPVSVKVRVTGSWDYDYADIVFTITIMLPQYMVLEPLRVYYINVTISDELSIGSIGNPGIGNGIRYIDIVDLETMDRILRINLGEVYIGSYVEVYYPVADYVEYSSDGRRVNFTAALVIPDDPQLINKLKGRELGVVIRPVFEGASIYTYPYGNTYSYQDCNITYVDMPAKLYFVEQGSEDSISSTPIVITTTAPITATVTETITKFFTTTQTIGRTTTLTYTKTITSPITVTYTKTTTVTATIPITKTITKYLNETPTTTHVRTVTSKIYIPVNRTITYTVTTTQLSTKTITTTLTQITTAIQKIPTIITAYAGNKIPSLPTTIMSVMILLVGIVIAIIVSRK